MNHRYHRQYPIGTICIEECDNHLINVYIDNNTSNSTKETNLLKESFRQLTEYFEGKRKQFDLLLLVKGTPFQKSVYAALQTIPYGEIRSYKEIANQIGNPKASQAVGQANNKNNLMIFVPCHRVIGSSGKIVGFGAGVEVQQYLLSLEKNYKPS